MARETVVHVWDDLANADGEKVPATETILYAIDDQAYSIDLNRDNAAQLRDALAPFVAVSERLGRQRIGDPARLVQRGRPPGIKTVNLPSPPAPAPLAPVRNNDKAQASKDPPQRPSNWTRKRYRDAAIAFHRKKDPTATLRRLTNAQYAEYEEHCRRAGIDP